MRASEGGRTVQSERRPTGRPGVGADAGRRSLEWQCQPGWEWGAEVEMLKHEAAVFGL